MSRTAREGFLATVRILVQADDHASACDAVSEALRNAPAFIDWEYPTRLNEPRAVWVPDDYQEGDLLDYREVQ